MMGRLRIDFFAHRHMGTHRMIVQEPKMKPIVRPTPVPIIAPILVVDVCREHWRIAKRRATESRQPVRSRNSEVRESTKASERFQPRSVHSETFRPHKLKRITYFTGYQRKKYFSQPHTHLQSVTHSESTGLAGLMTR